jgi:predicted metal-dependent hydrolase
MNLINSQIQVGNYSIDVYLKNIKNMHLAVYPPTGRIRISAPIETDLERIRLFAISKLSWIKKHQQSFNEQIRQPKSEFLTGESHFFLGKRYILNIFEKERGQYVKLRNKNHIDLYVKNIDSFDNRKKLLIEWYRNEMKSLLPNLIHKWESVIGVNVQEWGVKKMKTRWGSCNVDARRVWINLELIKKPVELIEYVVVHELVHLIEKGHGKRFYDLMSRYYPDWERCKKELNRLPI